MIKDGIKLSDSTVRSYLMIGQSNMAGRGEFCDVEPIRNPLCYVLRMGRWQPMSEPINPDRPIFEGLYHSGISLAASFADEVAIEIGSKVGLIPCADGGTCIDEWMPGGILYDHALMMTKLAMRTSAFSGIIWHQGENDCLDDGMARAHKEKFIAMITSLRRDLGNDRIPVIIGELSENMNDGVDLGNRRMIINRQYYEVAKEIPACDVVSAKGLSLKPDGIHFDSVSLREFGRRYARAYLKIAISE